MLVIQSMPVFNRYSKLIFVTFLKIFTSDSDEIINTVRIFRLGGKETNEKERIHSYQFFIWRHKICLRNIFLFQMELDFICNFQSLFLG